MRARLLLRFFRASALIKIGLFSGIYLRAEADVLSSATGNASAVETSQEAVRDQSQRTNGSLLSIIDDMKMNGLSAVKILNLLQVSGSLNTVNQQEMQKIIDEIKSIGDLPQEKDRQIALLNAYQQQRNVSTELKALALKLSMQTQAEVIIRQLEALILRQDANLRATGQLSKMPPQMRNQQNSLSREAAMEQDSIAHDTALLSQLLATNSPTSSANPPNKSASAEDTAQMRQFSSQSAADTRAGKFDSAAVYQELLKSKLLDVLAQWKTKQDQDTRLEQARSQVNQLLKKQKDVATATQHAPNAAPALAESQAKVGDQAELTHDVAKLNPEAGAQMEQAENNMQQSSDALKASQPSSAQNTQSSALSALANAAQLLNQQAAEIDAKKNESLADAMKDLKALKKDIEQTKQDVQAKTASAAEKQISQLQQEASPIAPQAAGQIGDAAKELQQSPLSSNMASQDLAAAAQSVQQQMDAAAQAAQEAEMLSKARDALNEAIAKATDADTSLKDAAAPDKPRVDGDLTKAQDDVKSVEASVAPIMGGPAKNLEQANGELKSGDGDSGKGDRPGGQQHVEAGIKLLKSAKDAMAEAQGKAERSGLGAMGRGPGKLPGMQVKETASRPKDIHEDRQHDQREGLLQGGNIAGSGAQVVGELSPKDRDALLQAESEKMPPEYVPMVQQYMKNLSDSPAQ